MFVIVGLGNPGSEYSSTLHNTGFRVIDELARRHGIHIARKKCKSLLGEGSINGKNTVLCKPQTYMNLSGEAIVQLVSWYKCEPECLLIVYDDIDLPFGRLRFRAKGSAGTHNGMRSIITLLGNGDFPRLRLGIGKAPDFMELKDYVLSKPRGEDALKLDRSILFAADAVESYIDNGFDAVMASLKNNES